MRDENDAPILGFLKKRWVKVVLVVDVALIVGVIIFGIVLSGRNAVINFDVTPIDAEISLNGRSGYENGEYKVSPGEYQVRITHEGLEPKEFTVSVEAHDYVTVATFLEGEDGFSYYELKENYADYEKLRAIVTQDGTIVDSEISQAKEFVEKFEKAYEIFELLPLVDKTPSRYGDEYGVNYEYDTLEIENGQDDDACTKTLCLLVSDTTGEKESFVKSVINKLGYNYNDYETVYRQVDYE